MVVDESADQNEHPPLPVAVNSVGDHLLPLNNWVCKKIGLDLDAGSKTTYYSLFLANNR